jgi:hypothetical protein
MPQPAPPDQAKSPRFSHGSRASEKIDSEQLSFFCPLGGRLTRGCGGVFAIRRITSSRLRAVSSSLYVSSAFRAMFDILPRKMYPTLFVARVAVRMHKSCIGRDRLASVGQTVPVVKAGDLRKLCLRSTRVQEYQEVSIRRNASSWGFRRSPASVPDVHAPAAFSSPSSEPDPKLLLSFQRVIPRARGQLQQRSSVDLGRFRREHREATGNPLIMPTEFWVDLQVSSPTMQIQWISTPRRYRKRITVNRGLRLLRHARRCVRPLSSPDCER